MIQIGNLTKRYRRYTDRNHTLKRLFLNLKSAVKNAAKSEYLYAVRDLTVTINTSEVFCITGPNGAGKSTLAKLLAGTIKPTSGKIEMQGRVIPFLELGVAFNHELTGTENLYLNGTLLGLRLSYLRKNKKKIFDFAEISDFMSTPLKYYSSGMQLRLAFSIAMHAEGDIYIFDEILAVGDASFQKKCFESFDNLLREKKTIIIVTHDIDFIQKHAQRLLIIKHDKHRLIENVAQISKQELEQLIHA